ncbi:AarF/UbiB family protein [Luteolibacter sp. SL250]|uniref:ABC1 kinase family protein n=1 Tax=Luteolibacter sp. SL250 TaxID=2995170 RepID=UPI0022718906|nr:AarF/UbiB family protein [Luteolibacter sp. SL250]WAC18759.1 AarF/UbiB family protein [Luteolibacter sp. SL250]
MKLSPSHLRRYKDVARLFLKYGNSDLVNAGGFGGGDADLPEAREDAKDLAVDLEKLGPTFVKIGQLLSTRSDLLPPVYLDALSRLQDKVEPVPVEEVEAVISEQLGVRISKAFSSFDRTPVGSASLGQVHRAVLREGREVAVKVQRPGIRKEILADLDSLQEVADFLDEHTDFGRKYHTGRILGEFRDTLLRELDYQKEARNLMELKRNLAEFGDLVVPEVVEAYSSPMVLTMDYLPGTKVTDLAGPVLLDIDGGKLADEVFRAYLKQILVDGFFHADPHPGNLLLTPDRRIAILDLGMVGRVNARVRDQLVHLLAGISQGDGTQVAEAALRLGESEDAHIDRRQFVNSIETILGESKDSKLVDLQIGGIVLLIMQACASAGIRIPAEISLLGKTLMNLDRLGIALSPQFDPRAAIRRNLEALSTSRLKDSFSIAGILGSLTETKDFLTQLPRRVNEITELVATNRLRVKVDSIDEHKLMLGFQKIANRITMGLLLSAFIVGSSMLARVETTFRIFGYPGLAMVFFFIAALGALWLMLQILVKDE